MKPRTFVLSVMISVAGNLFSTLAFAQQEQQEADGWVRNGNFPVRDATLADGVEVDEEASRTADIDGDGRADAVVHVSRADGGDEAMILVRHEAAGWTATPLTTRFTSWRSGFLHSGGRTFVVLAEAGFGSPHNHVSIFLLAQDGSTEVWSGRDQALEFEEQANGTVLVSRRVGRAQSCSVWLWDDTVRTFHQSRWTQRRLRTPSPRR